MNGPAFGARIGYGTSPAVIVIDAVNAYITPGEALYAPAFADAVTPIAELVAAARSTATPVIYTRVRYHAGGTDGGVFYRKVPGLAAFAGDDTDAAQIVAAAKPEPDDVVIEKRYASTFFGTPLASLLTAAGIDTVILCGFSTSGCVRASAVDACQHGFRTIVAREACADRDPAPHHANLHDIDTKYGDVTDLADVIAHLQGAPT